MTRRLLLLGWWKRDWAHWSGTARRRISIPPVRPSNIAASREPLDTDLLLWEQELRHKGVGR